ncbi:MAG TPA: thioredoxin family protein [Thermoanaerobaculia bacterium]|nr:thioredoxin family protein [Thermoanaerobaculia bacterium]
MSRLPSLQLRHRSLASFASLASLAGRPRLALAAAALLAVASAPVGAAIPRPEKATLALQAEHAAVAAGETARISALVSIEAGWHVNSHTPTFDYLIPTELELELPAGWPAAAIDYPPAKKKTFAFADVPLSVYDGDVVIATQVKLPAGAKPGAVIVGARLHYQACDHSQCLPPVTTRSQLTLTVAAARSAGAGSADDRSSTGGGAGSARGDEAPSPLPGHTPARLEGGGATATPPSSLSPPAAQPAAPAARRAPNAGSLAGMLLIAVLGGLILNAMPCVLPVVSLKIFGLVRSAAHGHREVVRSALAIAAGILASFAALAALAVAAAAAGGAVGWGVQFQRPGFVAFLAVVVTLFCLNLWGLFEIPLPGALARLGGAAAREGLAGHFFSGLFATLMATPCSAPFLGTAIGFGLAQPAPIVFAIFLAAGTGLALPYLVLAAAPGAARFFPRPGAWMETLRGVMGFLLAASAVWLLYVLAAQISPERLALFEVGLLLIALVTWLRHRAAAGGGAEARATGGGARAGGAALASLVALVALVVVAAGAVAMAASGSGPGDAAGGARLAAQGRSSGLIGWVAFDRARAESLAAAGQLVFVDVTADWCFTCKVNERLILDTPEIAGAFAAHHVLPMRADWTNRSDAIARFLADNGRYGIPFYMLYRPGRQPVVFSELPTKTAILAALDAAAAPAANGEVAHKL